MQPSQLTLHRGLDELVLESLASSPQLPAARPSDSDVSIEVVFEDDSVDVDDLAVTNRFVRFSAPYERVELEELGASLASLRRIGGVARPRTFVKTVPVPVVPPPSATLGFDKVWFEQPEEALAAIEDPVVETSSRWWSMVVTMVAVAAGVALVLAAVYAAG